MAEEIGAFIVGNQWFVAHSRQTIKRKISLAGPLGNQGT
jgi:hypothetical protein